MLRKVATNLYSAESATKKQLFSYDCLRFNVQPNLNLVIEVLFIFFGWIFFFCCFVPFCKSTCLLCAPAIYLMSLILVLNMMWGLSASKLNKTKKSI